MFDGSEVTCHGLSVLLNVQFMRSAECGAEDGGVYVLTHGSMKYYSYTSPLLSSGDDLEMILCEP